MNIEIAPGEKLTVTFKDSDGSFEISFSDDSIKIETEWPDSTGREGVIYEEKFEQIDLSELRDIIIDDKIS